MLRGVYGTEGRPPWLRLEGPIAPDESAMLIAQGQTGDPDYAVGRVRTGTRVSYGSKPGSPGRAAAAKGLTTGLAI